MYPFVKQSEYFAKGNDPGCESERVFRNWWKGNESHNGWNEFHTANIGLFVKQKKKKQKRKGSVDFDEPDWNFLVQKLNL